MSHVNAFCLHHSSIVAWGKGEERLAAHLFSHHLGTIGPDPWINGYPSQKGQIYFPSGLQQVLAEFACVCRISGKPASRPLEETRFHTTLLHSFTRIIHTQLKTKQTTEHSW